MSRGPLISVIVPARNMSAFVSRTLNSALAQSHQNIEVVVVDDGSTDDTAMLVEATSKRDPRVRLIRTGPIGVAAARNLAIAKAKSDLIAPMDADDLWHPRKLERQLAVLQAAVPNVGVVYSWTVGIDEDDRIVLPRWIDSTATGNVLHELVVRGIVGNGSTPLIRRRLIEAVGGYDAKAVPSEDWKFYTALAGVCEFALVPQHLTAYRLRNDSASSVSVAKMERAIARTTKWIMESWPDLPPAVLRDRKHVVCLYLAFLATRSRRFGTALKFTMRAITVHPGKLWSVGVLEVLGLLLAHAAGLRVYRWDFWRRPPVESYFKSFD